MFTNFGFILFSSSHIAIVGLDFIFLVFLVKSQEMFFIVWAKNFELTKKNK